MKLDEPSVADSRGAWNAPPGRPVRTASGRAPDAAPAHGTGMAREGTASKPAWRRQALARFRTRSALLYAALRPRAGRALPDELLASGVRIFEYQTAILHAKTLVVDEYVSVVGSSNLDFRSFYFNAECNVLILDDATGRTMARTFQEDLGQSVEMRLEAWNQRPLACRLGDAVARCLSPLL